MSKLSDYVLEINKDEKVTHFTMKCPHCGWVYVQDNYSDDDLTREIIDRSYTRYGSPVRKCGGCGETFLDRSMREPALIVEPIKGVLSRHRRIGAVMAIAGTVIALVCLFADFEIAGLLGIGGVALIILGLIRVLAAPQGLMTDKQLKEEYARSQARCADPQYRALLKENGIIPAESETGSHGGDQ